MAKQSELERIAIDERTSEFIKSPYTYDGVHASHGQKHRKRQRPSYENDLLGSQTNT